MGGIKRFAAVIITGWLIGCPSDPPATDPQPSVKWSVTSTANRSTIARGRARWFVYAGPRDLDRGLPGVVEDGGRGPAYGLLGGYFAPRVLAADTSSTSAVRLVDDQPQIDLPGIRGHALPPTKSTMSLRIIGGGTFAFPADRTEVTGLLDGRPSFSVNVSAGADPGYQSWRADTLTVRPRSGGFFTLTTACRRVLLLRPVPKGSTSVFLLHLGPQPAPTDPLFVPSTSVPDEAVVDQARCDPTATSTLTLTLP